MKQCFEEDSYRKRNSLYRRSLKVILTVFILYLGVVLVKGKGTDRKDTYDITASFGSVTQWYTDSIPKDHEEGIMDHCVEWWRITRAINEDLYVCFKQRKLKLN